MSHSIVTRAKLFGLAGAAALSLSLVAPAMADDSVTTEIQPGDLTAYVSAATITAFEYSHAAHTVDGTMTLNVDDSTGSNSGWFVTIESSDFVWSEGTGGAESGTDIPAANFALTSAGTPAMTAGQAVDPTNGPKVPETSPIGELGTPRTVVEAAEGYGNGTYTQELGVDLDIPAYSAAGTYTGTLTTTIAIAP